MKLVRLLNEKRGYILISSLSLGLCFCKISAAQTVVTLDFTPNFSASNTDSVTYAGSDAAWYYDGAFQNEIDKFVFTVDTAELDSVPYESYSQTTAVTAVAVVSGGGIIDMTEWVYIRPSQTSLMLSFVDSLIVEEAYLDANPYGRTTVSRYDAAILSYGAGTIVDSGGVCDISSLDLSEYVDFDAVTLERFEFEENIKFTTSTENTASLSVVPEPSASIMIASALLLAITNRKK